MKCCAWEYFRASVAMSAIRRLPVFSFAFGTAEKALASATKAAVAAEPTVETNWRRVHAGAGFEVFILRVRGPPPEECPTGAPPEGAVRKRNVPMRSADPTFLKITNYHLPFTNYKFLAFAN